ncbi:MAG: 4Fe-4S binding protein [Bacteroidetes bacterium]|nr:4Fe-4S binding protein [Bacteroidota bacterium]
MLRDIVKIDEDLCDGCGLCIPNCHEGALQIIDDKARLVSDLMCDGLGACLGHCPLDAITIEQREAEAYDEVKVMAEMVTKGKNVVVAHLKHLKDHDEHEFLQEGVTYLMSHQGELDLNVLDIINEVKGNNKMEHHEHKSACGCPGSQEMSFDNNDSAPQAESGHQKSELTQWPVQMHLVNPNAPYYRNSDVVIAADCVAFAMGSFHKDYLQGRSVGIACPKLDSNTEVYIENFKQMIDDAKVNTLTVMIMEVPCCGGLIQMVQSAAEQAERKVPVKQIVVGVQGDVLAEQWI